jgi:hypothetical protein
MTAARRLVRDRLDEPAAEQRDRHAARDDVRRCRNHDLTGVGRNGEQLEQGASVGIEVRVGPILIDHPGSHLGDRRNPPDSRHIVTSATARPVVRRSQSFLGVLHLKEVLESDGE